MFYYYRNHPDPSTWSKEVLVPMGSMISQSEWDHILSGLQPSTEYTVQLVLTVQGTEPVTSPVFTYTTLGEGNGQFESHSYFCDYFFFVCVHMQTLEYSLLY